MYFHGKYSHVYLFSLGSSVPIEIGEMDGRNAGSAVIGFVNGMYIFKISFSSNSTENVFLYKAYHSFSLIHSHHIEKHIGKAKKKSIHRHIFKKKTFGMTQQNETQDNIGMN